MPITVTCHICRHEWKVADVYAGRTGWCPKCAEEVSIPGKAGSSPKAYEPTSLPSVSAVEVVALAGVESGRVSDRLRNRKIAPGVRATGEAAARVASLWRGLVPGLVSATHLPVYGLRFLDGDRVIGCAAICWVGGSVRGEFGGRPAEFSFEGFDPNALALYQELSRITGATSDH